MLPRRSAIGRRLYCARENQTAPDIPIERLTLVLPIPVITISPYPNTFPMSPCVTVIPSTLLSISSTERVCITPTFAITRLFVTAYSAELSLHEQP